MLVEPANDPDVGETARAAAAEGHADTLPLLPSGAYRRVVIGRVHREARREENQRDVGIRHSAAIVIVAGRTISGTRSRHRATRSCP
jgi:hypothetical protein